MSRFSVKLAVGSCFNSCATSWVESCANANVAHPHHTASRHSRSSGFIAILHTETAPTSLAVVGAAFSATQGKIRSLVVLARTHLRLRVVVTTSQGHPVSHDI